MADIDLSTLTPRARTATDRVVVMQDGSPDAIGLIDVADFLPPVLGPVSKVLFTGAGGVPEGAADVEIEGGQLRLPAIPTPAAPAAGGLKLFGRSVAGRMMPAFVGPSGLDSVLQPHIYRNKVRLFSATGNGLADTQTGVAMQATGASTSVNVAATNFRTRMSWREWLVTTAATTAVAGLRGGAQQFTVGANIANAGGFYACFIVSPATGVANTSHRLFVGMRASNVAPTDVNPSTLTNLVGMGYDSADGELQLIHNDGAGAASKIALGAGFPKPSVDRIKVYRVELFSPPGTTQAVHYQVTDLETGEVATGTITTDLPSTTTLLNTFANISVGGVSSVVGLGVSVIGVETDQ